jgi:O-antigen ligase
VFYGLICFINGFFFHHYEIFRAVGELRRFFYYSFAFFLGLNLIRGKETIKKFEKLIPLLPITIIIFATKRIITGQTWAPEVHFRVGDFRAMSYWDGICLIFVFSYLLLSFLKKKRISVYQTLLVVLIPFYIYFSGFRLLWGLFFLSIFLSVWLFRMYRSKQSPLRSFIIITLCLFCLFFLLENFGGKDYESFKSDVAFKLNLSRKNSEAWRFAAWKSAIRRFQSSPIIGIGLGADPAFWFYTSFTQWIYVEHTVHNAYIELLYQTGIIGLSLFLLFLGRYIYYYMKNIKILHSDISTVTLALFILFICGMVQSFFQPYLNHPGNGVVFFSVMGITLSLIRLSREKTGADTSD